MGAAVRRLLGRPEVIAILVAVVGLVATLALRPGSVHPYLKRDAVIGAALKGYDPHKFKRVEAKLMHRDSFEHADAIHATSGKPDELIWVVAVSGNYGLTPSFGCCSVPADYPGHNTWGVAIIADGPGVPTPREFEVDYHGEWPPFFDGLPDLAAGA